MRDEAQQLVDEFLRPLIEADGGRIELLDVEDGEVVVRLSGTCAGCPGRPYTLEHVIVPAVRRVLGETVQVVLDESSQP